MTQDELRVNGVRYQHDNEDLVWLFFHDGGWEEVDSADHEAFLDYIKVQGKRIAELEAENKRLRDEYETSALSEMFRVQEQTE